MKTGQGKLPENLCAALNMLGLANLVKVILPDVGGQQGRLTKFGWAAMPKFKNAPEMTS